MFGFGLACLMVILGVLVATDRLVPHTANPGADTLEQVRAFYAIPLADMLMFSTFVYLGFRNRMHPTVHKRLMLFATRHPLGQRLSRCRTAAKASIQPHGS